MTLSDKTKKVIAFVTGIPYSELLLMSDEKIISKYLEVKFGKKDDTDTPKLTNKKY